MHPSKRQSGRGFRRVRGLVEAALVFVIAVSLAACTDRPATDEFASDTSMFGDTTGLTDPYLGMVEDTISVDLASLETDVPQTISSGEVVFEVENSDTEQHGLEIELVSATDMQDDGMEGEGMQDQPIEGEEEMTTPDEGIAGMDSDWSIESLEPGESEILAVNLEPGTYRVFCPVHGGMEETTVHVQDNIGASTTATVY